ncbi:hypothetical protein ES703_113822 [subsurface metagenome]
MDIVAIQVAAEFSFVQIWIAVLPLSPAGGKPAIDAYAADELEGRVAVAGCLVCSLIRLVRACCHKYIVAAQGDGQSVLKTIVSIGPGRSVIAPKSVSINIQMFGNHRTIDITLTKSPISIIAPNDGIAIDRRGVLPANICANTKLFTGENLTSVNIRTFMTIITPHYNGAIYSKPLTIARGGMVRMFLSNQVINTYALILAAPPILVYHCVSINSN